MYIYIEFCVELGPSDSCNIPWIAWLWVHEADLTFSMVST